MRSRMLESLRTAVEQETSRKFGSDELQPLKVLSPEKMLKERRSELRNSLTDMQQLFFVRKAERPERQRCGTRGRLFGKRG